MTTPPEAAAAEHQRLTQQLVELRERQLSNVRAAAQAADTAGQLLADAVRAARSAGISWGDVAEAAGMSRQGAQQRWGGTR